MKDRWGNSVRVGWAKHELVWLEAALALDIGDRAEALEDISAMSGRTLAAVRKQANRMAATIGMTSAVAVKPPVLGPSAFRPDMRRLMGGR